MALKTKLLEPTIELLNPIEPSVSILILTLPLVYISKGIADVPPASIAESELDAFKDKKLPFAFVSLILKATAEFPLFEIVNLLAGEVVPIPKLPFAKITALKVLLVPNCKG